MLNGVARLMTKYANAFDIFPSLNNYRS